MTVRPISIDKDDLVEKALSMMNDKKITSLCVYDKKNKKKLLELYIFIPFCSQIFIK